MRGKVAFQAGMQSGKLQNRWLETKNRLCNKFYSKINGPAGESLRVFSIFCGGYNRNNYAILLNIDSSNGQRYNKSAKYIPFHTLLVYQLCSVGRADTKWWMPAVCKLK